MVLKERRRFQQSCQRSGKVVLRPIRRSCSTSSMLPRLLTDWKDIFTEIVFFLSPKECENVAVTCTSANHVICGDFVWQYYCLHSVPGFHVLKQVDLVDLCSALGIPSLRRLFYSFQNLQAPLLGYYSAENVEPVPIANGGLFCIKVVENTLVCHRISGKKNSVVCIQTEEPADYNYGFLYDPQSWQVVATTKYNPSPKPYYASFDDMVDIRINSAGTNFGVYIQSFHPLPPLLREATSPPSATHSSLKELRTPSAVMARLQHLAPNAMHPNIGSCLGFFSSNYGPHGSELLYLSIVAKAASTARASGSQQDTESNDGFELQALKMTGDRNVPAGKLSFVIDLDVSFDIQAELQADPRPALTFVNAMQVEEFSLAHRASRIARWYKGRGQINYVPGTWDPKWVGCNWLLYDTPFGDRGAVCAVLWDDLGDDTRHAMEVFPAEGGGEGLLGIDYCFKS